MSTDALSSPADGGRALIESLDLSRPDMASIRLAWDKGDLAAARKSFAHHLRTRQAPHWYFDPSEPPRTLTPDAKGEADDALNHKLTSISLPHQFGEVIDWSLDATSLSDSPVAVNHEWTWQLNRHPFWLSLAQAYNATGDARYGLELSRQLRSWIESCPPPAEKADQSPRSRWRTIEAGIRMYRAWPEVYFRMVRQADVFDDDALLLMVDSMRQHAEYLDRFVTARNWKTMESNGLFHVATIFPEFKNAARWRKNALDRQFEELGIQVYPDGSQVELAPGYHNVSLVNFVRTLTLARLNDIEVPAGYAQALERMYDANLWAMLPDRTFPNFNDSARGDCIEVLREGLKLFPDRQDWRWVITEGKEGCPPDHASHLFDYAGWGMMRSGWDRDARCLAMQAGPFGAGHQHEDKLNFILDAYGSRLLCEGGIFTYDASVMRRYVLSPAAHNIVSVDGLEQHRRGGPADCYVLKQPAPIQWQSAAAYDYLGATYGDGADERWGDNAALHLLHRRQVLFVKPDYWVVIDTLSPRDDELHTYQSLFHLDADRAVVDPETKSVTTINPGRATLCVIPAEDPALSVNVVQGQHEPYQGWIADTLYKMRAIPTITYTRSGRGDLRLIYAFVPVPPGQQTAVRVRCLAAGANGVSLEVQLCPAEPSTHRIDRIAVTVDGNVELART